MIKKLIYLISFTILFSCSSIKLENEWKRLTIQSTGKSIAEPDVFVTYLNVDKRPINQKINCNELRDSIYIQLKSLLSKKGVQNYNISKGALQQNKAYSSIEGKKDKLLGIYCQSSIGLTLFNQHESEKLHPILVENFNVASQDYYSSKMDSLNKSAYTNAIKNANILAESLMEELGATTKRIVKITNVIEEGSKNKDSFFSVKNHPSWIYGNSFLQAIRLLKKNVVIAEKNLVVEYEIK